MKTRTILLCATALGFGCHLPASAQEVDSSEPVIEDGGSVIVVTGARLRAQVDTDQAPILELNEEDIAAYGAGSIADLVDAVSSQTGSSRGRGGGRPVFLVNGMEVSSFREFRSYPPEAIRKVEVLPEEVAQKFGYPPDRRVMNFILKDNFSSREIEAEFEAPDRGGYWRNEQEATLLRIADGGRLNVNLEIEDSSGLTEGERGVIQASEPEPGAPDQAFFRSLVADTWNAEATANWSKAFLDSGSSLSLNGTYERSESLSLSGLDPLQDYRVLTRENRSDTVSSGASYNRPLGNFRLSLTADGTLSFGETQIDRRGASGFDLAEVETKAFVSKANLQGRVLSLPAGDVSASFAAGFDWKRIDSADTRSDVDFGLVRRRLSTGANVTVPIAERDGAWGRIGDLSLGLRAGVENLSDFGTIGDYSVGLTWGVTRKLTLAATHIGSEAAPSLSQLGSPRVDNFNVPVFDFATGESVLATIFSGGNPDLLAETQRDWKFSANWELPEIEDARLSLEYIRNRSRDVTSSFPLLTPAIEAAFPDRVSRDADGTLLAIDQRPVTFAETAAERLVIGLTKGGSFGKAKVQEEGAGRRGGGGPPMMMGRGGDGKGRYFVNLNHTIELENSVLIAPGLPRLDLLDGGATSGYGLSRNTSTMEAGFFREGKGLRISGRYTGPSDVGSDQNRLRFGSLATLDLRVFADLGQLFEKEDGVLDDLRLSLKVDNLFDGRRKVTDVNGDTPLSYQPFLIDPTGRYLGIDIRKMF